VVKRNSHLPDGFGMRFKFNSAVEAREFLESSGILDEHIGILRKVGTVKTPAQFPPVKVGTADATTPLFGPPELGSGIGFATIDAYMAAVVECLERNLPRDYMAHHLVRGRYSDFADKAVDPNDFLPFLPEQYTDKFLCKKYHHDMVLGWIDAWSVTDQKFKRIPAQIGGFSYDFQKYGEPFLLEQISTGCAGHMSSHAAIASSLQEVVERHSTMSTWYSKGDTYLVDCAELFNSDESWARIKTYIDQNELDFRLIYLPNTFKIPVTCCICFGKNSVFFKPYAVGASARPSLWESAKKSILEMFHTMIYFSRVTGSYPKILRKKFASPYEIVEPLEHPAYYANRNRYDGMAWLWKDAKDTVALQRVTEGIDVKGDILTHFRDAVRDSGRDWLLIDFTPNGYRKLGFRFAKSIMSHFVPMNGMHAVQGMKFVEKIGHSAQFFHENPHPFP